MKFRDRIFSSFLDDGEKIMHVAHRHLIIFKIDSAKPMFFGIVIPAILYLFFPQVWPILALWGIAGLLGIFYYFIDWYYDAWLLTDAGVVDVERDGQKIAFVSYNPKTTLNGGTLYLMNADGNLF